MDGPATSYGDGDDGNQDAMGFTYFYPEKAQDLWADCQVMFVVILLMIYGFHAAHYDTMDIGWTLGPSGPGQHTVSCGWEWVSSISSSCKSAFLLARV